MKSRPTRPAVAVAALLLAAATGCGSRIDHQQVVADNAAGRSAAGSAPAGTGQGAAGTTGGGTTTGSIGAGTGSTGGSGTAPSGGAVAPGRTGTGTTGGGTTGSGTGTGSATTGGRTTAAGCAGGTGTIKLGNVAPYSASAVGANYTPGRDILQVWQQSVNDAGGICGRKVQVISRDDKGNASENAAQVKDLVENQKVVAFVGQGTALTLDSSLGYLEQHHVAVIGGDILSLKWSTSPALIPQGAGLDEAVYATIHSAIKGGRNKMGFLYCAEAQACQDGKSLVVDKGIGKKAGADVVYTKQDSLTAINFASECQDAKKAGADILFVGGDASFVERVANSCGQQGITFQYTTLSLAVQQAQQDNQYLNNHFSVSSAEFAWTADGTPAAKEYQATWRRYDPQLANSGAAASNWVAAKVAQQVVTSLGAGEVSQASVWKAVHSTALKGYDAGGLTSPLTSRPGGQGSPRCAGVAEIVNGRFVAGDGGRLSCRTGPPLT